MMSSIWIPTRFIATPLLMPRRKHRDLFCGLSSDGETLDRMCELNVQMQVRRVASTPIVEGASACGRTLSVHEVYG